MADEEIAELITRRRRQVLAHSVIYYKLNENLISNAQWPEWALELETLQRNYPEIAERCEYAKEYRGFDHSTGMSLPLYDPWAVSKAHRLLNIHNKQMGYTN